MYFKHCETNGVKLGKTNVLMYKQIAFDTVYDLQTPETPKVWVRGLIHIWEKKHYRREPSKTL